MKTLNWIISAIISATLFANCSSEQKGHAHSANESHHEHNEPVKKKSKSPRTNAMANIGSTHVHINYSSPGVRGRTIWGGLVAYDKVWVTGAHKATSIKFHGDVKIAGKEIKKGKYALFTIPGKTDWTIIINENFDQHLADDYDESLDIVRVKVVPEILDEVQESLAYKVEETSGNKGKISIMWEKMKVSFEVETL